MWLRTDSKKQRRSNNVCKETVKKTKNVLIISASFRPNSNSHALCQEVAKGVKAAGNKAEVIRLKDKKIGFCTGCYACQKLGKCALKTTQRILSLIRQNPSITRMQISDAIGLSLEGVKWNLDKLKASGIIRRVGPDRGGHWEIIEE